MPEYYTWTKYSSNTLFNFSSSAKPDGVVVFLGTNDYSGGSEPGLDDKFTAAYLQLMRNVTQVYYGTPEKPANITFFATLGPMSPTLPSAAVQAAVTQGKAAGYKIELINATTACGPELKGCVDGCATHPGVIGHRAMMDAAVPVIRAALGW